MRFVLEIDVENAAFYEDDVPVPGEVVRLLRTAADRVALSGRIEEDPASAIRSKLLDSNGNTVGTFGFVDDE